MKFQASKLNNREIDLSQVTVFLGANGVGKSSILNDIKAQVGTICPGKKAVYVEGGRTITLQNTLQLNRNNVDQFQDFTRAKTTYEGKRQNKLSDRVYDALMMLERKELAIKAAHSDAVHLWASTESETKQKCPIREQPPLEKLFELFHEIFPRLRVKYNPDTKNITVKKGETEYSISNMSDGEKQAFSILADFVDLDVDYGIVIVDEPELNLHPDLAERIWNLIESEFPDKIYCYATHSLSFALRSNVENVIVLSETPENITQIEDLTDFTSLQLTEFLGSIPGIISASKVVVTEGTEKSFDSIFYRWVLGDDQIEIMPAGDCEQVINVCHRDGIWSKIAPKVSLVGVIDRDFRSSVITNEVQILYREAESYLGIPALAVAVDGYLSIKEKRLKEEDVIEKILSLLNKQRHLIYANIVASQCGIRLGISVKRSVMKDCIDKESLIEKLNESSQKELSKATEKLGVGKIEQLIEEAKQKIDKIIVGRDWSGALTFLDGKGIGTEIAHMVGVRNTLDLMRSISSNIKIVDIAEVKSLSDEIVSKLGDKSTQSDGIAFF